MNIWIVIIVGGVLTYAMRLSFIYFLARFTVPGTMQRALRFVPPAVLAAIVLPELIAPAGTFDFSVGNHRLLAGCIAMLVAWRTKNVLATILAGMFLLAVLQLGL